MTELKFIARAVAFAAAATAAAATASIANAEDYVIDTQGAHASINFKISHLGFSWMYGRFDDFSGSFSFDKADPASGAVSVEIEAASINSNHAERDKHLRSADFLDVATYPTAKFVSTSIALTSAEAAVIKGDLTLRGVTKPIEIAAEYVGGGDDPWGNYRQGFVGKTEFALADFGMDYDLGPASRTVEMTLNIEGVRQ